MELRSDSFNDGEMIPSTFAMGKPAEPATFSDNRNPHLSWTGVPEGTQSFVLLCIDREVPTRPDEVNQEGKTVPFDLPRADFVHWVLIDIPADVSAIDAGAFSEGVTAKGKNGEGPFGRQGINDYTSWFAGDAAMEGTYLGYDGPFPPWNDERIHRYEFELYALDVAALDVPGELTATNVEAALGEHVLARAKLTGTYHIYADARAGG